MINNLMWILMLRICVASDQIDLNDRFDCLPNAKQNQTECLSRGCIWRNESHVEKSPQCYFNPNDKFGFVYNTSTSLSYGKEVCLTQTIPKNASFPYPLPFKYPSVVFEKQTNNRLRVKIYDKSASRYEVPINLPNQNLFTEKNLKYSYDYQESQKEPFSFKIFRQQDDQRVPLWNTNVGSMMLSDQFLQVSAKVPSEYLYGIGEISRPSFKRNFTNWERIPLFSRDIFPYIGYNINLYGTHPFYMMLEEDGKAHGVLLLNSNAMEIILQPGPSITYRTIGGILDFYFFLGPTPEDVVKQYTEFIGRPYLPAYWALGFQLCRYGYNSLEEVKDTVKRMNSYDIPQDVQYGDIDYMDRQLDFTYNNITYADLPKFVTDIKESGIKYITILDPAISSEEPKGTYEAFDLGAELDIWIKDETGQAPLIGKVWPDKPNVFVNKTWPWDEQTKYFRANATFPDWFHPNISLWWNVLIKRFHKTIAFDGLWIDMNEPANFVTGSVVGCSNNKLDNPPYKPNTLDDTLAAKTVCMSALHADNQTEYNYHSLFGWKQSVVTLDALKETTGKRGIVISRSTFPSSGKYAGHWLGDNKSEWPQMHESIIGMMDFSLFGISYTGADICGFNEDTTESLCLRWTQLGAFYPMSRNHNGLGFKRQDPAAFGLKFAKQARKILLVRYELLPFLYTLMYHSHVDGATVVRPMLHVFPYDKMTWNIDTQFFWGSSLLITPVLKENATLVEAYFPRTARWYNYFTKTELPLYPSKVYLYIPIDEIGLHIKGGSIIPIQEPAKNTKLSCKKPMKLLAAYDKDYKAEGDLFWDDGESLNTVEQKKFLHLKFSADKSGLTITRLNNGYQDTDALYFNEITILGLNYPTGVLYVNGVKTSFSFSNSQRWTIPCRLRITQEHRITWTNSGFYFKISIYFILAAISAGFALVP